MNGAGAQPRREALFLAHRIPYPPDKGDKIRSWRALEHLASRFDMHLAAFVDDKDDVRHREFLESVCASVTLVGLDEHRASLRSAKGFFTGEPLSFPYYRAGAMKRAVARLRQRDLAFEFAFSSSMAPYLAETRGRARLIDLCDADSEKWRAYAAQTRGVTKAVYAREASRLAAAETAIINWAEASFAVSAEEAAVFNARPGLARKVGWFGNGVDAAQFDPLAPIDPVESSVDVVFVGAMDYRPNVEAATWFARAVWPRILARRPKARFAIVGARPNYAAQMLKSEPGVTVTGRVADVRPWLKAAKVVVAPLLTARGVQNKVLEAMAMARPVVATPEAAEGVSAVAGSEIVLAQGEAGFAEAVLDLMKDRARAEAIGAAARARMIADHAWDAQLARLDAALDALLGEAA